MSVLKMYSPSRVQQLLSPRESTFPRCQRRRATVFSPRFTSSPIVRAPKFALTSPVREKDAVDDLSASFSSTSISSGDITQQAIRGVDDSIVMDEGECSLTAERTALEYVDPTAFLVPRKCKEELDECVASAAELLRQNEDNLDEVLTSLFGLNPIWKPSIVRLLGAKTVGKVNVEQVLSVFSEVATRCNDDVETFMYVISQGVRTSFVTRQELRQFFVDIAPHFQGVPPIIVSLTLTERLLWDACRVWSGVLKAKDVRAMPKIRTKLYDYSNDMYSRMELEACIGEVRTMTGDLRIARAHLEDFNYGAVSPAILDRIFSKNVVRFPEAEFDKCSLSYAEFLHFYFAHTGMDDDQSVEYWFRVLDTDGDGKLSAYEIQTFYDRNIEYLDEFGVASIPFADLICQYADSTSIGKACWTLADLKKSRPYSLSLVRACVDARQFFASESEEKRNVNRTLDEEWGFERTDWERYLDGLFDDEQHSTFTVLADEAQNVEVVTLD